MPSLRLGSFGLPGELTAMDDGALILVVDDDPVLRNLSGEILRRGGYRVEEAENGGVALEKFRENMPALVLMDVQMPVMDGLSACAEIRKVSDFATTPVLMLTSLNDPDSIDRAFNAGATDFIPKPVNPRLLLGRVRFALRLREMAADLQRSQTDLRRSEESRDYLLNYDLVTGLPNEALFMDRLRQAVLHADQDGTSVALLMVGMENCAVIANSLGAEVCDRLVKMLAERLASCILEADTVARLSFGHFGMILSHVENPEKAAVTAAKAIEVMMQEFDVDGRQLFLDAHAGISMYPLDGPDAEAVFNSANTALGRAREEGSGVFRFFKAEMNARAHRRLTLETDLRRAVLDQEFSLNFQPQLDLKRARVAGFEALLRWCNHEDGPVSPAEFVPILEETGLIKTVSPWVLKEACVHLKTWREMGFEVPCVSVNLSARDFQDPDLPQVVRTVLSETGITPGMLELEITESVIMTDPNAALATLNKLKTMGVRIALDDFGTGYSSLAYLQKLPVDVLKIDRSFVADMSKNPDNEAIVRSTIELAHGLGLEVVAEGVEDQDVLSLLRDMGCETAQGFFVGRPMAGDDVANWLETRSADGNWKDLQDLRRLS
ncbi:MAG: EAL domain-containing protein [Acidobacteriota bacterium]